MLPVVLLGIVLVIAAGGIWLYCWSNTRAKSKPAARPEPEHVEPVEPKPDPLPVPKPAENPGVATVAPRSFPAYEPPPVKDPNSPDSWRVASLKTRFTPEDRDIYYKTHLITERGWIDLEYALETLTNLPTPVTELLEVLNNPMSSASQVASICEESVELTAMVLKLVNSPFYGLKSSVDDITQAVALLGFDEIRQIVYTMSLFRSADVPNSIVKISQLWQHSVAAARITSWLTDRANAPIRIGLAGTGAMLHDVGKLLLQCWRPYAFQSAVQAARDNSTSLLEEELKILGLTHAYASSLLADRWNLPYTLNCLVKECHKPELDPQLPEAALVYLSSQVARHMELGEDGEAFENRLDDGIRELLKIREKTMTELISRGFEHYAKTALSDITVGFVA